MNRSALNTMHAVRTVSTIACVALSLSAHASDWQYAGSAKFETDDAFLFYDNESLQRPSEKLVRYWLKSITRSSLNRFQRAHKKTLVEKTAEKIAVGYVPRFYRLDAIRSQYRSDEAFRDAVIDIASYEIIANDPDALIQSKLLIELDCVERKSKVLEMISYDSKGTVLRRHGGGQIGYQFIPPDTNVDWQLQLTCPRR